MAEPQTATTLVDWLDDLTVRFLLNLPSSELSSVPRLCFQVEEAQWFYEDFVRPAVAASGAPPLPSLPLRQFCLLLFQHCPLLSGFTDAQHIAAYEEFLAYKVRVPVRGAILLDERTEKVVLVRGWKKGASWSFPRGKINKDERDLDCAIREVYEETGYDVRQADLVPNDEEDVKYIDITMREQHMRLFVFRGVPEDTHFEPKTRKEISKIQWYAIRDLPGFKKQKTGQQVSVQGGEAAHAANKFYMVAPFLGPLKKWISLQRKKDQASEAKQVERNGYAAQTTTEDEGEAEDEQTPERDVPATDESSEALKRLLSIGGAAAAAATSPLPSAKPDVHSGTLLAMLQGTANPTNGNQQPRTPFDQINAFPQQPETPQPDHLRHPSITQQQQRPPPPQFPYSPPHLQQQEQQRNYSLPTPNIFGPGPGGFPPNQAPPPPGFQGMGPPYPQHQPFQQRQSMPGPPPGFHFSQQNGPGRPFSGGPMPAPQAPPPHMQQPFQQPPPPNAYLAQGLQGAIGSGPAVPSASQLPPPRLNAQSMKLLDAFRSAPGNAPVPAANAGSAAGTTQQRPASTHQTALLDLFRKPSSAQSPPVQAAAAQDEARPAEEPASPTLTDVTVKPSKPQKRKTTLNEITRTLPVNLKSKSPVVDQPPIQRGLPPDPVSRPTEETPKERQLFDPDSMKFVPASKASPQQRRTEVPQQRSLPNTLQPPPPSKQGPRSPKSKHPRPAGWPSRKEEVDGGGQNGAASAPQFTILPRPGSAKGAAAPPSPLQTTEAKKPAFQPQLLKRPKASDAVPEAEGQQPADKKDQLLALFGKAPAARNTSIPNTPKPAPAPPPPTQQLSQMSGRENAVFNDTSSQQRTPTQPPPAPRIEPERRPTSSTKQPTPSGPTVGAAGYGGPKQQQNLLLDLFNKRNSGSPLTSPGTPISPFTLGTPAGLQPGQTLSGGESRSRLGSVTSTGSGSDRTPTETKEFLMGFLNGVVRNEGHRGAGR